MHSTSRTLLSWASIGALCLVAARAMPAAAVDPAGMSPGQAGAPSTSPATLAADWPQFHRDASHAGDNSAETGLPPADLAGLRTAWWASPSIVYSSPAVSDGVAYVGSTDGRLYAYPSAGCHSDAGPCTPIWTAMTGGPIESSPAVADGVVYVGSQDGSLYAFAVACGSGGLRCHPLWTGRTGDGIYASPPTVADGVVYVGSDDGRLYAFAAGCASDGARCAPLWVGQTGNAISSSPAVADGVVYVGSEDHSLYAFAVGCAVGGGTCAPLWTGATGGAIFISSATVSDGVAYVGSDDGRLYAFAVGCASGGGTCTPLWTGVTGGSIHSSPAVSDGVVYVGSDDHSVYAFAVRCASGGDTCTPLWTGPTGGQVESSPAIADGAVYAGSLDGSLYAFAVGCGTGGSTCMPIWTSGRLCGGISSSPAVADGSIYVGSRCDGLLAFDLDTEAPTVTAPLASVRVPSTLGAGSSRIAWSGTDGGTGISAYRLQQRIDGAWRDVALRTPGSTSVAVSLPFGVPARFRVRATDHAGNSSAWRVGPVFTPVLDQDTSNGVTYRGNWTRRRDAGASGGTRTDSTDNGASATLSFTGRTVAYVAATGPTAGSAQLLVDGVLTATVSLHSVTIRPRRVLFSAGWAASGHHEIRIRIVGSPGHQRVDIDAFLVYR